MNLSVCVPGSLCLHGRSAETGFVEENNMRPNYWGGPGPFSPSAFAARHAGLGVQPQGRECGSAGGRERLSRPPPPFGDRDDAWMLQGVRELGALCVCAHGLLAGVGLEQGMELDREQEQIGAGG